MKRWILSLFIVPLLLCSCNDYRKLEVDSCRLEGVNIPSLSLLGGSASTTVRLSVRVNNPTRSRFVVKSAKAYVHKADGSEFAYVESTGEIVMLPRTEDKIPVALDVKLCSPLSLLASKMDFSGLYVDLDVRAKSRGVPVHIKKKDLPVSALLERFHFQK